MRRAVMTLALWLLVACGGGTSQEPADAGDGDPCGSCGPDGPLNGGLCVTVVDGNGSIEAERCRARCDLREPLCFGTSACVQVGDDLNYGLCLDDSWTWDCAKWSETGRWRCSASP